MKEFDHCFAWKQWNRFRMGSSKFNWLYAMYLFVNYVMSIGALIPCTCWHNGFESDGNLHTMRFECLLKMWSNDVSEQQLFTVQCDLKSQLVQKWLFVWFSVSQYQLWCIFWHKFYNPRFEYTEIWIETDFFFLWLLRRSNELIGRRASFSMIRAFQLVAVVAFSMSL